jgi:hypothetical protein
MVKIRGQRVEISEIEYLLQEHPQVRENAVIARPSLIRPDQTQLVAYVVLQPGQSAGTSGLRQYLASKLPAYSIPSYFVFLDQFPLNVNGKVDRGALPEVREERMPGPADPPAGPTEEKLAAIWSAMLNVDQLGALDSFFERGGDSLLMLSMTLEVEKAFSRPFPKAFFNEPTIRNLASLLEGRTQLGTRDAGPGQGTGFSRMGTTWPLRWSRQVKRFVTRLRANLNAAFLFEGLLTGFIRSLSFEETQRLVLRVSHQRLLIGMVYRSRRKLFLRLLRSLGISGGSFRMSVVNNLMVKIMQGWSPFDLVRKYPLASPSGSSGDDTDPGQGNEAAITNQADERYPIEGFDRLRDAYRAGRGVVLLSFHGTHLNLSTLQLLAGRLGCPKIETISHNAPLGRSALHDADKDELPPELAASLYAEVSFHGLQLLQQGRVIHIAGDKYARSPGLTHSIQVGDRIYTIKTGFTELSLNTGAPLIPVYARFIEDGRLLTVVLPPLEPGPGTRAQQVEALVRQYGRFMDSIFRRHPDILSWTKIGNHFREPRAGGGPAGRAGSSSSGRSM